MRQVSDSFLLLIAEVSSGLTGLFLVGVFFYVETGFRRSASARAVFEPYIRASTRIVLILFALAIGVSLTLVAMEPVWPRLLFLVLSAILVAANIDTAARIGGVNRVTGSAILVVTEVLGSLAVVGIVVTPWALGGLHPSREDLAWAVLLSFGTGFLSICAVVLSVFDIPSADPDDQRHEPAWLPGEPAERVERLEPRERAESAERLERVEPGESGERGRSEERRDT